MEIMLNAHKATFYLMLNTHLNYSYLTPVLSYFLQSIPILIVVDRGETLIVKNWNIEIKLIKENC